MTSLEVELKTDWTTLIVVEDGQRKNENNRKTFGHMQVQPRTLGCCCYRLFTALDR